MLHLNSTFLCYSFLMWNYLKKQVAQSKELCFVCEVIYSRLEGDAERF